MGELLTEHDGGGGVDGDGFRGHFPVPAGCRHRNFGPPKLVGDGGGDQNCFWRKGFGDQRFLHRVKIGAKVGH